MLLLVFIAYALLLSLALYRAGYRHRGKLSALQADSAKAPEKILIIGATGGTGRELVLQGLKRGLRVTALVRNPARLQLDHPNLTVVQGDVLDPQSIDLAMHGQEAVLSALGHKRYFWPGRILSNGTRNVMTSMKFHNVPRFICETSLGIGSSAGRMGLCYTFFVIPVVLPLYYWDKTRQERLIADSDLQWVIVRPALLTNDAQRGILRHGRVGSFVLPQRISRADVADFMLNQLNSDSYLHDAPGISCSYPRASRNL